MSKKNILIAVSISLLAFTSSLGGYIAGYNIALKTNFKSVSTEKPITIKRTTSIPLGSNIIADVAEEAMPWVVNIKMEYTNTQETEGVMPFPLMPFEHSETSPKMRIKVIGGSGIIIRKDGYIITNRHVIEKANAIEVNTSNGKTYKAKVIGVDEITDLAILQITDKVSNLPAAQIGNSSSLRIGEWVIAVGSPLGYERTVTQGIISAINRQVKDIPANVNFIQTDAAINPGNSGGPLINLEGKVIGINTAIRADAQNIGFAIPINTAVNIAEEIINNGHITRPWVGIEMRDNRPMIGNIDIEMDNTPKGVAVNKVWPGSPASKAGVKNEDLILKIDGKEITDARDIQNMVRQHHVGDTIKLDILRNNRKITLKLKTEKLPDFSN